MTRVDFWDDPNAPAPNSIVPSVTAVVVQHRELLLIHKVDNNRWALPGGAIDLGESSVQAAIRETQEETGIEIEILGLIGVYTRPTTRHALRRRRSPPAVQPVLPRRTNRRIAATTAIRDQSRAVDAIRRPPRP